MSEHEKFADRGAYPEVSSLRDQFAMATLTGLLHRNDSGDVGLLAYAYADKMLTARQAQREL